MAERLRLGSYPTSPGLAAYLIQVGLLAGVYYGLAEIGLSAGALKGNVTPVWPPTGLALAALVLFGRRLWPGVALGALVVNALDGVPLAAACGMAVGNTLEAVIGASLLGMVPGFRSSLERVVDVVAVAVLGAGLSTAVSASVGVTSLTLGGVIAPEAFWATWRVWWVGDALGALVVAPAILTWARLGLGRVSTKAWLGGFVILVGLIGVTFVAFSGPFHSPYLVFPLLVWAALLLRQRGATAATLVVAVIAVACTVGDVGPFVSGTVSHSLWTLDTFLAVVGLTTLTLAAVVSERDRADRDAVRLAATTDRELVAASRLAAIVESSADAIIGKTLDGVITSWNAGAEDMYGYTAQEMVGRNISLLVPPERADELSDILERVARGERFERFETERVHKDGHRIDVSIVVSPVHNMAGRIVGASTVARDISDEKLAVEALTHQAMHDALTDLPNRTLLLDRLQVALERAGRRRSLVAVVFVDVDEFKDVNTAYGHAGGDELLSEVAGRLASSVRGADTVARFGGDEFVVISEGTSLFADNLADRLRQSMETPCTIGGTEVPITVSMGVAVGTGLDHPDTLLRDADIALLQAKAKGRNRTEFFSDALRVTSRKRIALIADLRRAMDRREFSLRYQPLVHLDGARIIGAEALLRWERPGRGTVLPEEFISLAEETGLIIPIGRWVIEESCRRLAGWQTRAPEMSISVNISARQLADPDLDAVVAHALSTNSLEPSHLVLEVTEGVLMDDVAFFGAALDAIRNTGVRIAIDDFGTGYSSLAYLKRFSVDVLKIDQCFIAGLPSDAYDIAVIRAVIAISQALNLAVVAEGVESEAQARTLMSLGCHDAHGYHFYRPLTGGVHPLVDA